MCHARILQPSRYSSRGPNLGSWRCDTSETLALPWLIGRAEIVRPAKAIHTVALHTWGRTAEEGKQSTPKKQGRSGPACANLPSGLAEDCLARSCTAKLASTCTTKFGGAVQYLGHARMLDSGDPGGSERGSRSPRPSTRCGAVLPLGYATLHFSALHSACYPNSATERGHFGCRKRRAFDSR